jgi:hypothetical protein
MVLGLVRLRRHLFARQAAFGTPLAALRAYPFQGVPIPDLGWTNTAGDFGSRVNVAPPTRGVPNYAAPLTDASLNYNDLALQLCAFFGGQVSPTGGGTAKTWAHEPDFTTTGSPDLFTYERGSDADGTLGSPNDWFRWSDGILTGLTIDSPEDGRGVLTTSMNWLFGDVDYAGDSDTSAPVLTIPSITDVPDNDPTPLYLKDASVFITDDPTDIGGDQITDTVHKFTLALTQEVDQKRFVNGSQEFDLDGYGMGAVTIAPSLVMGKTGDSVGIGSESDAWFSDLAVDRYLQVVFESTREAQSGIPYSWAWTTPLRWYTREDGEIGGNETLTLAGEAFLETGTLDFAFSSELVNTLAEADLGVA